MEQERGKDAGKGSNAKSVKKWKGKMLEKKGGARGGKEEVRRFWKRKESKEMEQEEEEEYNEGYGNAGGGRTVNR